MGEISPPFGRESMSGYYGAGEKLQLAAAALTGVEWHCSNSNRATPFK